MAVFELVIGRLLAGVLLAAWAQRIGAPHPARLSLAEITRRCRSSVRGKRP